MTLKQTREKVEYTSYGQKYEPDLESRKARAFAYALACAAINDIGAGADENLYKIKEVIGELMRICEHETGFSIDQYDIKLVGSEYSGWKKNPYRRR